MPQARRQPAKKTAPPKPQPSHGSITVMEDGNDIRLIVEVHPKDNTSEDLVDRIRAVISGMLYVYDKDRQAIEALGQAYLDGVETGIRNAPGSAVAAEAKEEGLSMGFTSSKLGGVMQH